MEELFDFLEKPNLVSDLDNEPAGTKSLQIGGKITRLTQDNPDWEEAEIILVGCGSQQETEWANGADKVRTAFFKMYDWHPKIYLADLGNIRKGASTGDTRIALKMVLNEIYAAGKIVLLLGRDHDQMMAQYEVFEEEKKIIEAAVIDRFIDLNDTPKIKEDNFLMTMLTRQPNFMRHFNILGFQSYDVNPQLLETMDKLGFDCFRLGHVREHIKKFEPVLRQCDLIGIDLQSLRSSDAKFLEAPSPNGFFGDEICQLAKYAGMSSCLSSFGVFGYHPENDEASLGAQLIAQMLWYFIDGIRIRKKEADLINSDNFISYHVAITGMNTLFMKSKFTGRWWMQLPDQSFIPCSYEDYQTASRNSVPNRWLRAQERIN